VITFAYKALSPSLSTFRIDPRHGGFVTWPWARRALAGSPHSKSRIERDSFAVAGPRKSHWQGFQVAVHAILGDNA
jgi:hypothetical protein